MKNFRLLMLSLVFIFPQALFGQGTATGCLITDAGANYNKVFTSKNINLLTGGYVLYNNSSNTSLSTNYCSWQAVSTTGNTCAVCSSLGLCLAGICVCLGTTTYGYEGTFNMIACDLDDYCLPLGLATGLIGFIWIQKRKNFNDTEFN
ncbi:hypothetical protein [Pedobacter punctiformis]|uniref:Uncharacterized protein n=1 Tax=Pedobacter punctiformis TaxID=3004097 RepID=A0ABT4L9V2_9SPHI|nr:hypothetical protein [Pedobacter sp. HCMS5-2]MCZ4244685.1 hypothetical protein [Pedobacter sp. HCMS5-2]